MHCADHDPGWSCREHGGLSRCGLDLAGIALQTGSTVHTQDVPSPIDWSQADEVRSWVDETARQRPYRAVFFAAFAQQINEHCLPEAVVLELGSGPGLLAEAILNACSVASYSLLDFSAPMHALAQARLGVHRRKTHFLQRDFRAPDWGAGLGPFDAIVTLQAAHEVRHKRYVPRLLESTLDLLLPGGCLLFADHCFDGAAFGNADLYMTRDEQREALIDAGFGTVECVLDHQGMALFRAERQ